MTKIRMTKAQKAALALEAQTAGVETVAPETIMVETATTEPEVTSYDPSAVAMRVAESQAAETDELYVPVVKPMKVVKTVKTGVGVEILRLIAQGELSNKEIVAKVIEDNPLRKTTYACVAWYKSQVAAGKIDLPQVEEETSEE